MKWALKMVCFIKKLNNKSLLYYHLLNCYVGPIKNIYIFSLVLFFRPFHPFSGSIFSVPLSLDDPGQAIHHHSFP